MQPRTPARRPAPCQPHQSALSNQICVCLLLDFGGVSTYTHVHRGHWASCNPVTAHLNLVVVLARSRTVPTPAFPYLRAFSSGFGRASMPRKTRPTSADLHEDNFYSHLRALEPSAAVILPACNWMYESLAQSDSTEAGEHFRVGWDWDQRSQSCPMEDSSHNSSSLQCPQALCPPHTQR